MAEQWRKVRGHPGYEASTEGRVRSVDRVLRDGRVAGGMVLAPYKDSDGYLRVTLGRKNVPVHRVVVLAFHGPPEVRHLNGNQLDNTPGNLAWGSHAENERDKKRKRLERIGQNGEPPWRFRTPPETPLRLSDAVAAEVVTCSLAAIRKAAQRDALFPPVVGHFGVAALYEARALFLWDWRRR